MYSQLMEVRYNYLFSEDVCSCGETLEGTGVYLIEDALRIWRDRVPEVNNSYTPYFQDKLVLYFLAFALRSKMDILLDNLESEEIANFLQQHIDDMRATSPPESKHALDLKGLKAPEITFWSIYDSDQLLGCAALKELGAGQGEVKSMRVLAAARGLGVGSKLVDHVVAEARDRGYQSLWLETGSMPFFKPARNLYLKHGFTYCEPFGSYKEDPNSVFMTRSLV